MSESFPHYLKQEDNALQHIVSLHNFFLNYGKNYVHAVAITFAIALPWMYLNNIFFFFLSAFVFAVKIFFSFKSFKNVSLFVRWYWILLCIILDDEILWIHENEFLKSWIGFRLRFMLCIFFKLLVFIFSFFVNFFLCFVFFAFDVSVFLFCFIVLTMLLFVEFAGRLGVSLSSVQQCMCARFVCHSNYQWQPGEERHNQRWF